MHRKTTFKPFEFRKTPKKLLKKDKIAEPNNWIEEYLRDTSDKHASWSWNMKQVQDGKMINTWKSGVSSGDEDTDSVDDVEMIMNSEIKTKPSLLQQNCNIVTNSEPRRSGKSNKEVPPWRFEMYIYCWV